MRITADTNILLRLAMSDDIAQQRAAAEIVRKAELIAITLPTLCEFVWVMRSRYKRSPVAIASALRKLLAIREVVVDEQSVDAGLAILERGGDFADGVIAYQGRRLGGDVFVTFDEDAARLLRQAGGEVGLLSPRA